MTRELREIVIHASMTGDEDVTLKDLDRKHRKAGWNGCGYHYVIRRDGTREQGRDLSTPGAHVKHFDKYSIGICMIGGKPGTNFTEAQWISLKAIVDALTTSYPHLRVMGHRDCPGANTTCPTFDVAEWWASLTA